MSRLTALWVFQVVAFAAVATASTSEGQSALTGYLTPGQFDLRSVLPAAPQPGDARAEADRAIFRATRSLAGTSRYRLAISDAKLSAGDLARDFSCSVGFVLTPENAPATIRLIARAAVDTGAQTDRVKALYRRQRPYKYDKGGTCERMSMAVDNYDYPSGHTTLGWTWATILAQIVPDRATSIYARGRAYGESRAVCGAHNWSAVENGFLSAATTMGAVSSVPAFQANLAAARDEVKHLRADPTTLRPDASACAQEATLISERVYSIDPVQSQARAGSRAEKPSDRTNK